MGRRTGGTAPPSVRLLCGPRPIVPLLRRSSQMPRHLISDAHEWINEIPTVPTYYTVKPQPRERAWV